MDSCKRFEFIEKLATSRGCKRIAVENFLMSLGDLSRAEAFMNLELDADLYKWNTATQSAIVEGIIFLTAPSFYPRPKDD